MFKNKMEDKQVGNFAAENGLGDVVDHKDKKRQMSFAKQDKCHRKRPKKARL